MVPPDSISAHPSAPGVYCEHHGDVAWITLNNPAYDNCLTVAMWDDVNRIADRLAGEPTLRAVVVRGAGSHFTSGFDLASLCDLSLEDINHAFLRMELAISQVERLTCPVIAAVEGWCLGGGLELALAADFIWAGHSARLGMPIARLGIMLSSTFASRLVRAVGISQAKELLYTGRIVSAEQALPLGLVNHVSAPGELWHDIDALTHTIRNMPARAVKQAKLAVGVLTPAILDHAAYFVDETDFRQSIQRFRRS